MRTRFLLGCSLVLGGFTNAWSNETTVTPEIQVQDRGHMTVKLADQSEGYWTLQRSTDMQAWESINTAKAQKGAFSYSDTVQDGQPNYFYRLLNANTADNVFVDEDPFTYQSLVPNSFIRRESIVFVTPASSGGGGWAGSNGVVNEIITISEDVHAPEAPIHHDEVRDHKAYLGRVLFYDKRLSANDSKSCASCHKQENAFADNQALSEGFHGEMTVRNSMPLANLAFASEGKFFWDMRESNLRETVLRPIEDPVEMGMDLKELPAKLCNQPYYGELFEKAYGDAEVTEERIADGLASFLNSMVSARSKFDRANVIGSRHFSAVERLGESLFKGKAGCAQCHTMPFFDNTVATNNGLDINPKDLGVALHSEKASDNGFFKTPSLRNVELTAPYMHDGRFKTLEEVVDFYNRDIKPHDELDPILRIDSAKTPEWAATPVSDRETVQLDLSESERDALVAFMETLTDYNLVDDERFSDPFKK